MPWITLKVNRRFGGTCCLHLQSRRISQSIDQHKAISKQSFILVSCMAHSSTLMMEVRCSSETSVGFQWTIRRYIPEGRTLLILELSVNNVCEDNRILRRDVYEYFTRKCNGTDCTIHLNAVYRTQNKIYFGFRKKLRIIFRCRIHMP
jgi:hypothetical protein